MQIKLIMKKSGTTTETSSVVSTAWLEWPKEIRLPQLNEAITFEGNQAMVARVHWPIEMVKDRVTVTPEITAYIY